MSIKLTKDADNYLIGSIKRFFAESSANPMTSPDLERFIAQATKCSRELSDPADCVLALAPLMLELIGNVDSFLEPEHFRSEANHYTRNLVYRAPDDSLSLYASVWLSGQWTPVHDHGSCGVVNLHLHGRMMSTFNIHDVAADTRRPFDLAHNES